MYLKRGKVVKEWQTLSLLDIMGTKKWETAWTNVKIWTWYST